MHRRLKCEVIFTRALSMSIHGNHLFAGYKRCRRGSQPILPGSVPSIHINIDLGHVKTRAGDSALKLTDGPFRANDEPSVPRADDMQPSLNNRRNTGLENHARLLPNKSVPEGLFMIIADYRAWIAIKYGRISRPFGKWCRMRLPAILSRVCVAPTVIHSIVGPL